jgi:hypothetical protein
VLEGNSNVLLPLLMSAGAVVAMAALQQQQKRLEAIPPHIPQHTTQQH